MPLEKKTNQHNRKHCKLVGCTLRGYWVETQDTGEKLIRTFGRHGGENHIVTIPLAELVLRLLCEDSRFRKYFNELKKKKLTKKPLKPAIVELELPSDLILKETQTK